MPYLMNGWYMAAFSDEVGERPIERTLLDIPVVLYRLPNGKAVALHDRCPHRFAPLSEGLLVGSELQCPYHGLRFGADGACVHNPHGPVPKSARVRSFPIHEQYGLIWFWPGDPEKADPDMLPDLLFLEENGGNSVVFGHLHVDGNYQLVVDNLLDLTHAPYLHPQFAVPGVSTEERLNQTKTKLIRDGDRVSAMRWRPDSEPNAPTRTIFGFTDERMDSRSHMHWYPPSLIHFDLGAAPVGGSEHAGLCIPALHAITPESELSCHYFFAQARNVKPGDPDVDRALLELLDTAFRDQDEPMIERQQRRMGSVSDLAELDPILLKTDAAPVEARRVLARLIAEEKAEA
ncbi:aromatic ring-hydroxylating dioxygenase subunit alpha [Parasphingopyxis marina]|uniref:Aromatic ring-hydroxylating dioxygenase subunit alpha n=1 Tax=Parasphingopyxis marina TaxID=2761622 RepID=A0A842HXM5_9SPHN|nr:aromatic ring-hydroxylating dioxygenase subunit alpha [Parasphingopyxis marina]MBC2778908.1 aromatic ring-hydroxylating dioxygenase subunit alpha [Parasphingopyxis marina]